MRRRALLTSGLAGLTGLAGCAGVFGTDRERPTVNPALRDTGTETEVEGIGWRVDSPAVDRLSAGDGVIVTHERGTPTRLRGLSTTDGETAWATEVDLQQSVSAGDVLVSVAFFGRGNEASTQLTGVDTRTGARLWRIDSARQPAGITADTVVLSETRVTGRTVAYDRRDGTVRWQTPPGERNWFPTTDPVITFTGADAADGTRTERATTGAAGGQDTTPTSRETSTPPETSTSRETSTSPETSTPRVTPATTTENRPIRLQGRDTDTGRLLWSVAVPAAVGETVPAVVTDGRLFATDGSRYFLFDTATGRLVGEGALPSGLQPRRTVVDGDRAYIGDAVANERPAGPARLAWVNLADGTVDVRAVRGRSVRPLGTAGGRLLTSHWGDAGYAVVGRDPDGTPDWIVRGAPFGGIYERAGDGGSSTPPGVIVVGDGDEVRAHAADGSRRWRATDPVGGRVETVVGPSGDGQATALVSSDRVVRVGPAGVASWTRADGSRRTAVTSLDRATAWTVVGGVAALSVGGEIVGVGV